MYITEYGALLVKTCSFSCYDEIKDDGRSGCVVHMEERRNANSFVQKSTWKTEAQVGR